VGHRHDRQQPDTKRGPSNPTGWLTKSPSTIGLARSDAGLSHVIVWFHACEYGAEVTHCFVERGVVRLRVEGWPPSIRRNAHTWQCSPT
jgi:hypothetical protein